MSQQRPREHGGAGGEETRRSSTDGQLSSFELVKLYPKIVASFRRHNDVTSVTLR